MRLDLPYSEPLHDVRLGAGPLERGALLFLEIGEQVLRPGLRVFASVLGSVGSSAEASLAFFARPCSGDVELEDESPLGCTPGSAFGPHEGLPAGEVELGRGGNGSIELACTALHAAAVVQATLAVLASPGCNRDGWVLLFAMGSDEVLPVFTLGVLLGANACLAVGATPCLWDVLREVDLDGALSFAAQAWPLGLRVVVFDMLVAKGACMGSRFG